jgi:hypothetical protein
MMGMWYYEIFSPVMGEGQGSIVKLYSEEGASKFEGWFRSFCKKTDRGAARESTQRHSQSLVMDRV